MKKHCSSCGTEILMDAQFCATCGARLKEEVVDVATAEKTSYFNILVKCMWAAVAIDVIYILLTAGDARYYYNFGRTANMVSCLVGLLLSVWLAFAFMRREKWTRIGFMVDGCFLLPVYILCTDFSDDMEWTFPSLLNYLPTLFNSFLFIWSFRSDMRIVLRKPNKYCGLYLVAYVWLVVGGLWWGIEHIWSDVWVEDCKKAMNLGSESAKKVYEQSLDNEQTETVEEEDTEETVDQPVEQPQPVEKDGWDDEGNYWFTPVTVEE